MSDTETVSNLEWLVLLGDGRALHTEGVGLVEHGFDRGKHKVLAFMFDNPNKGYNE